MQLSKLQCGLIIIAILASIDHNHSKTLNSLEVTQCNGFYSYLFSYTGTKITLGLFLHVTLVYKFPLWLVRCSDFEIT